MKEEYTKRSYKDIEKSGSDRLLLCFVKRQQQTRENLENVCIDDEREWLLAEPEVVVEQWRQYFEVIANIEFPHPIIKKPKLSTEPVTRITEVEVEEALRRMQKVKATSSDNIPTET